MNPESVLLRPKVAWPRRLAPGRRYLVTVELEHSNIEDWPYDGEEYPITCVLAGDPDIEIRVVGSPTAVLHRFGGTYGPVRFIVRALREGRSGADHTLALTLLSAGGVPIRSDTLRMSSGPQDPDEPEESDDRRTAAVVWFGDNAEGGPAEAVEASAPEPAPGTGPASDADPASMVEQLMDAAMLRAYQELDLSGLGLTALPEELGFMTHLTALQLGGNRLTELPDTIWRLTHLVSLDLSRNQLTSIPYAIGQLEHLTSLDLSDNQLTDLPYSLGELGNLTHLSVDGNPRLSMPPPDVTAQGADAILAYLRDRAGTEPPVHASTALIEPAAPPPPIKDEKTPAATPVEPIVRTRLPLALKVVIAGGFGMGKSTAIKTVSEITPLRSEAVITEVAAGVDDLSLVPYKTVTTVAMDFGRLTLDPEVRLYLFGTPGSERFWFMWDNVTAGAIGALVVADTRRFADCFPAVDYFEAKHMPFAVAVNTFDGVLTHPLDAVRAALDVADEVPVLAFDARDAESVRTCLIAVLETAMRAVLGQSAPPDQTRD